MIDQKILEALKMEDTEKAVKAILIRLVLNEERKLSFSKFDEADDTKTKIEVAMEIISEFLEEGPHPVSEINAACAEEGICSKTAQRARKRLGVKQEYVDGVPVWMF